MSNDSTNSLLTRAWRGALVLCGIAVLLVVAVRLIESVWPWLVGLSLIVLVIILASVSYRRWRSW